MPKAPAKISPPKPVKTTKAKKARPQRSKQQLREIRLFTQGTRRKRAVAISITSAFSALIILVLATMFTPLLAVGNIQIGGANRLSEKSIENALKSQIGKPLPMVSSSEIATALKPFALIESFTLVSLPPHTLRINITERQPIAIIGIAGVNYLYDPAGVRVARATGSEKLPYIAISGNPENSKEFRAAIDVLMALPAELLSRVSGIDAKSKDDVTLTLRGYAGQRIIWGDQSNAVLKSKVLDALIANQKKSDRVIFDVSSPNAPVVRYGNF